MKLTMSKGGRSEQCGSSGSAITRARCDSFVSLVKASHATTSYSGAPEGACVRRKQGGSAFRPAGSPEASFSARAWLRLPGASAGLGQSQPLGPRWPPLDRAARLLASDSVVRTLPDVEGGARALRPRVRRARRSADGQVRVPSRGRSLCALRQRLLRDARAWRDAAGRRLTDCPAVLHGARGWVLRSLRFWGIEDALATGSGGAVQRYRCERRVRSA